MNRIIIRGSAATCYNRIMNATTRLFLFMVLTLIAAIAVPVIVTATTV
jgi:hypothetical protein